MMVGMLCRTCAQPLTTTSGSDTVECSSCRLTADWHRLPAGFRGEVDALLRRRSVIGAMRALRERDPGLRLPDAQVMAEMRLYELDAAGACAGLVDRQSPAMSNGRREGSSWKCSTKERTKRQDCSAMRPF
jgi:LSD1 subclass zinc finger protein